MKIKILIEVEMKDLLEKCRLGNGIMNPKCVLKIEDNTVETKEVKVEFTETDEERLAVAKNPNTPSELLIKFAEDKSWIMREVVAANPNTPGDVLSILAKDSEYTVRLEVAENPNTPKEILPILAKDSNASVRYFVKSNVNTPIEVRAMIEEYEKAVVIRYRDEMLDRLWKENKKLMEFLISD